MFCNKIKKSELIFRIISRNQKSQFLIAEQFLEIKERELQLINKSRTVLEIKEKKLKSEITSKIKEKKIYLIQVYGLVSRNKKRESAWSKWLSPKIKKRCASNAR